MISLPWVGLGIGQHNWWIRSGIVLCDMKQNKFLTFKNVESFLTKAFMY